MNDSIILTLVDNTHTGSLLDNVNHKGYSHISRLTHPNEGLTQENKRIWFYNYGMKKLGNKYSINKDHIFLSEAGLEKSGVIVERVNIDQKSGDFAFQNQDWFKVTDTNCTIPIDSVVIVRIRSAYRFNRDSKTLYFVPEDSVLLFALNGSINPAPDSLFVQRMPENPFSKPKENYGILEDKIVMFGESEAQINIEGKDVFVVKKNMLIGEV